MSDKFSRLADEFILRIRTAKLTSTTDVALIFHLVDAQGKKRAHRESIIPTTVINFPTTPGAVRSLSTRQVDAIIDSIERCVRQPEESQVIGGVSAKLVDITLDIIDAG